MESMVKEHSSFIQRTWEKIETKVAGTSKKIKDSMPYTTINGKYDDWQSNASWWTNTFWTGILWHMYRETKDESYRQYAESIELKMDEVLHDYDELHHDVGFMWLLSSVMNYEQTGNKKSKARAMLAASVLSSRANIAGGYIRAWNDDKPGWAIIDCMMNVPLLFWASEQSKDARFKHIGVMHADKTLSDFIREDGSVNHIVIFDENNGEVLDNPMGQGYESGSSWSRGQSWAIYGFAQSYHWTQKPEYLHAAKRVAHYALSSLALCGYVPPSDYRQPESSTKLDSSAGAITACGLIEIAKAVPDAEKKLYLQSAIMILKALDEQCAVWDESDDCILTNGTSTYWDEGENKSKYSVQNGALIYGDFYFVEAICKLKSLI